MSPTRPINMRIIITNFPTIDKSLVIPRLIPHVPNADVISKMICVVVAYGSVICKIIVAISTIKSAKKIITKDLNTSVK